MGAFTGTLDFSANNPNVAMTNVATGLSVTGAGSGRALNCGTGTFTFTTGGFDNSTSGGSTITCGSSTFVFNCTGTNTPQVFQGGTSKIYGNLIVNSRANGCEVNITATTGVQLASLSITGPARVAVPTTIPVTITSALTITGNSSGLVEFGSSNASSSSPALLTVTGATITASWAAIKNLTVTGGPIAGTAIFDVGGNTGVTASPPAAGGGRIIGG
jgi:hypothetical protein